MNNLGNYILVFMFYSRIIGILEWWIVMLLLMEVIICRDARYVDTAKILSRPSAVRLRMFKASWKNYFYKGTFVLFFCALFSMFSMISDMWLMRMPRAPYTWTLVSLFLPLGIIFLYRHFGYQITFFEKFKLFMQERHG